jgi:dTDP-4-amino-4,6-dideoxygalactose transaminase
MNIPFNKLYFTGKEIEHIKNDFLSGKTSGDGIYTKKNAVFFEQKYGFKKSLFTTSCTAALELSALLLNIQPGDEVIAPSYTFVSTVNPFLLRGAKILFADSEVDKPHIALESIKKLMNPNVKALVVMHYAGIACEMDEILALAKSYNCPVIEDAAQCINAFYDNKPLGSLGTFGTISFHDTKNIISGEGGLLIINDEKYNERADILREKGTNRAAFFRKEVDKYGWVDVGSSFLGADLNAAMLYAQLLEVDEIHLKRHILWEQYYSGLEFLKERGILLPVITTKTKHNSHIFYLVTNSLGERGRLIQYLRKEGITSSFHYGSLHKSSYFKDKSQ